MLSIISRSGLFEKDYYLAEYPDVIQSGLDPLRHYSFRGRHEGRRPCSQFDPQSYVDLNPDVMRAGLDPFLHFIEHGRAEGRLAQSPGQIVANSGLFDAAYYRAMHLDVAASGEDPLKHYISVGRFKHFSPSLDFDPAVYLASSPDVGALKLDPFIHYIQNGRAEGRISHKPGLTREGLRIVAEQARAGGHFDDDYYFRQCPAVQQAGVDPLLHYIVGGFSQLLDPSPSFSASAYRLAHPEVALYGINPLLHSLGYDSCPNLDERSIQELILPGDAITMERKAANLYAQQYRFSFDPTEAPGELAGKAVAEMAVRLPSLTIQRLTPDVSIIIPVHGQLPFVLGCLHSLARQCSRYSVEIIIADDASPATTQIGLLAAIPWIRYRRSDTNLGFLDNCNAAASLARGRFLTFLNSDTRVVEGWLDELIGSFDLFPKAGLIGSALFNQDGTLQESGGIYWRDASAWNYGRNDDLSHPKYCFARPADYVSGAAVALPSDLWRKLGGFDTLYRPAYCEDADLAFRTREAGYEVWVQPSSRVIHYEGMTHGRSLTQGIKKHQTINKRRFFDKWKETLSDHRPNGQQPDLEAHRGVRNRILVLDAVTPRPDRDSGSFVTVRMLQALQNLGFQITFVPQHNYVYDPKYTPALQRMGIECLYLPHFGNITEVLHFRSNFDVVLAFRFNVLNQVYDEIRNRMPTARIIFHNVDLHFLRLQREAELNGGRNKHISAATTKAAELELMAKVDCTVVHTQIEAGIIRKHLPISNIVTFPYISETHRTQASFNERQHILFLGGFDHPPNVDAVKYFVASIWPALLRRLPETANFYIVGSAPTAEVRALAGPRIIVIGFVENLQPYFDQTRVFVAPLRYGAGIKGKVIQSLSYGTPSVISSCAAEGIGLAAGSETLIADDHVTFAEQVQTLYFDKALWSKLQTAGYDFVETEFSFKRSLELTAQMLDAADTCWLERHERALEARLSGLLTGARANSTNGNGHSATPTWVEPGHSYSPIVNPKDPFVTAAIKQFPKLELAKASSIKIDQRKLSTFFTEVTRRYDQLPFKAEKSSSGCYFYENSFFSYGDGIMLGLIMMEFQPKRIVEIGSGYSSAAMIDINEHAFDGTIDLTFVDPDPGRLNDLLPTHSCYRRRIHHQPVQAMACKLFKQLRADDILFIDSTHVSKMASDVNHLMFNIFPMLQPGVLIHLHDIFYPFEYPPSWILEENRSWNEAYLLRAFLQYNDAFEILCYNDYAVRKFPDLIRERAPLFLKNGGGSIWLRRVGEPTLAD